MKTDGGVRKNWLATSVVRISFRCAARNRISLMTAGQASASTQIFIRRSALLKKLRPLGFPTITFPCEMTDDFRKETVLAATDVPARARAAGDGHA